MKIIYSKMKIIMDPKKHGHLWEIGKLWFFMENQRIITKLDCHAPSVACWQGEGTWDGGGGGLV